MRYFWEERLYKGKWKVRLEISANRRAVVQALENIPQRPKHREIQKGEVFLTLIRLCHRIKEKEFSNREK